MELKSMEAVQKTHSESQTMELKSMEAGQKTHSESPMMELIEVNGSWAEDTLGEPDVDAVDEREQEIFSIYTTKYLPS
jgi:hypothetical protein